MYEIVNASTLLLFTSSPSQRLKENANTLQLRPEKFEDVLREIGFGPVQHLGVIGEGGRLRSLLKL
jgi:hypothetical protein